MNSDPTILQDSNKPIEKTGLIWTFDRNVSIVQPPQSHTDAQHRVHGGEPEGLANSAQRHKAPSNFVRMQRPTCLLQKRYSSPAQINAGYVILGDRSCPHHSAQSPKIARFSKGDVDDVLAVS